MTTIDPTAAASAVAGPPLAIDDLARAVSGPVLAGDDPRSAAEIVTFNLAVTHSPAVVVGATSASDVAAAVTWAREHGLPVAVQSTGHGPIRSAEGAVLVTTSRMRQVTVDPVRRTATAAAGVRWAEVLSAAAPHGLAPLSGSSSQVGVVGYTLGGGLGSLSRQFGFAADLVERVEMVTADGQVRQVDAHSDPDLFWAVRGGKGNFGIVTSLEFRLVPVSEIYGGGVMFAGSSARAVVHAFREWAPTLPESASASVAMLRLPPLEEIPEPLRGQFVVHLRFAYNGPAAEGERLVAPMREAGEVLVDALGPMPYAAADAIHQDPTEPVSAWERGRLLRELPPEAVDNLVAVAGPDVDVPLILVELRLLGGALARQPEVPNAVSGRDGAYGLFVVGPVAPGLEEVVPAVGGMVFESVLPWLTGTAQLNFLGDALTGDAVGTAWTPEVHRRLMEVKQRVDPDNLFCFGHALTER
jgi:FAD/FMN-containing dehydrogenase